jgi:hypothetical protein
MQSSLKKEIKRNLSYLINIFKVPKKKKKKKKKEKEKVLIEDKKYQKKKLSPFKIVKSLNYLCNNL